ncbi:MULTISPECIES: Gfo/Idh/MocA family oxidoreductase [unclassified Moorena]|uniref:Gfo/Idh/MocA family oxidoreductase n=1 Tax=unclassified Moorena TaxID=2683338 RepID=UPI0013FF46B0|nr:MULTISPECIES: Gfo/Idh/MocA family oxidoreductase [unclassified Moorena]NEO12902.1 Gfo/Idh/MocA family oxidoreductase [Moorena sp. SIO3E8]NEP99440.1 Gfo/Idh/MocA family oxidoreductase [Moorena sp. SIO3F7]
MFEKLSCVRVGDGHVASLHEKIFRDLEIETVGIIDPDPVKQKEAAKRGIKVCCFDQAAELKPFFWDICCPTKYHVETIKTIVEIDNSANIIVEKPICESGEIKTLIDLLNRFSGKLIVNENYLSSSVTEKIKQVILCMELSPNRVVSEMTKNRINDFINGRFLDNHFYAFGYEGSHIVTNVMALGDEYLPEKIGNMFYGDLCIDLNGKKQYLPKQAMVEKHYRAVNKADVVLYTSMEGNIKYFFPGYSQQHFWKAPEDTHTRYRVLAVEDHSKGITVAGFYEPILGHNRREGRVVVLKNGIIKTIISPIFDDTMSKSLKKAIEYFQEKRDNPCSAIVAMDIVIFLNLWYKKNNTTMIGLN